MRKAVPFLLVMLGFMSAGAVRADWHILTWTAPGDDGHNGTAAEYDLRYSRSLITAGNFSHATRVQGMPPPKDSDSLESFAIDDLHPDSTYFFAIKTADEAGNWSGISNVAIRPVCPEVCTGIRGNIDGDPADEINMADILYFVEYSFGSPPGPQPRCPVEADVDGSGVINVADVLYMAEYMFSIPFGPEPVACPD